MGEIPVSVIRDVFQILFYLVVGSVTIFTYRHARRTILQPIRTEVFKEQVKYFGQLLEFLTAKYTGSINDVFPVDELVLANTWKLFDDYAETHLNAVVHREERPYAAEHCRNFVVPQHLLQPAGPYKPSKSEEREERRDWKSYKFEGVAVPTAFAEQHERVRAFMRSPLAPNKLVALLRELDQTLHEVEAGIADLLTECAAELPAMYSSREKLNQASFSWIQNRYNRSSKSIEPIVERIVNFVREYFATETLMR